MLFLSSGNSKDKRICLARLLPLLLCSVFILNGCVNETQEEEEIVPEDEAKVIYGLTYENDINDNGVEDYLLLYEESGQAFAEMCIDGRIKTIETDAMISMWEMELFEAKDLDSDGEEEYLIMIDSMGNGGLGSHEIWFLDDMHDRGLVEMKFPVFMISGENYTDIEKGFPAQLRISEKNPYQYELDVGTGNVIQGNLENYIKESDFAEKYLVNAVNYLEQHEDALIGENVRGFSGCRIEEDDGKYIVWFPEYLRCSLPCTMGIGFVWYGLTWDSDGAYELVDWEYFWEYDGFE